MKRIFIASKIEPDKNLTNSIADFKRILSGEKIRWVDISNIHLTYHFLGNVDEGKIPALAEIINKVALGNVSYELFVKSAGIFKSIANPSVLWFGIEPNETMKEIKSLLDTTLARSKFSLNDHEFKPHLTIGRLKNLKYPENLKRLLPLFQNKIITRQRVNEIILFESVLHPTGPVYTPLFKAILKHDGL